MSRYSKDTDKVLDYLLSCMQDLGVLNFGVLKGAYNLQRLLKRSHIGSVQRLTSDLDFDLFEPVNPDSFLESVEQVVTRNPYLTVTKRRVTPNTDSMGLVLTYTSPTENKSYKFKLDFKYTPNPIDPPGFATMGSMFADKLSVNYSNRLLRRSKDAFDLYIYLQYLIPGGVSTGDVVNMYISKYSLNDLNFSNSLYSTNQGTADLLHAMDKYDPTPLPGVTNESIVRHNRMFLSRLDDTVNSVGIYIKQPNGLWI